MNATTTYQGQKQIRPVITPIYIEKTLDFDDSTVEEFGLSRQDASKTSLGYGFDHIKQNIKLAGKLREQEFLKLQFNRSVLNKSNKCNLDIIK